MLDPAISRMIYSSVGYKVKLLPPAVQFLDGLQDRLRAKVARSIRLLQEFGPSLRICQEITGRISQTGI